MQVRFLFAQPAFSPQVSLRESPMLGRGPSMGGNCCNRQMPDGTSHLECLDPLWVSASPDPRYPTCGEPGGSGSQPPVDEGPAETPVLPTKLPTPVEPVSTPVQPVKLPAQPPPPPPAPIKNPSPVQATPATMPVKPVEKKLDTGSVVGIGAVLVAIGAAAFFGGK